MLRTKFNKSTHNEIASGNFSFVSRTKYYRLIDFMIQDFLNMRMDISISRCGWTDFNWVCLTNMIILGHLEAHFDLSAVTFIAAKFRAIYYEECV